MVSVSLQVSAVVCVLLLFFLLLSSWRAPTQPPLNGAAAQSMLQPIDNDLRARQIILTRQSQG